jgi:hypothetical protein
VSRVPPHLVAAILSAICAVLPAGIWVILLFVGHLQTESVANHINGLLAKGNPARGLLIFVATLFLVNAALSGAYVSRIARDRRGALALLLVSCIQAAAAGFVIAWPAALIFAAPLYWAIQNWQQAWVGARHSLIRPERD